MVKDAEVTSIILKTRLMVNKIFQLSNTLIGDGIPCLVVVNHLSP